VLSWYVLKYHFWIQSLFDWPLINHKHLSLLIYINWFGCKTTNGISFNFCLGQDINVSVWKLRLLRWIWTYWSHLNVSEVHGTRPALSDPQSDLLGLLFLRSPEDWFWLKPGQSVYVCWNVFVFWELELNYPIHGDILSSVCWKHAVQQRECAVCLY
jgi:hypothetical protein